MEMGMTPELMYGQNVFVPATASPYQYGYAEVGTPMEWYNHPNSLGYDGQDVFYQTEGMQCVYYAARENGSMHTSYSPYPVEPSFIPDGSFMPQEYVADPANSTCQITPTPYYIPAVFPYAQDSVPVSATAPLLSNVAFLPGMPGYAATTGNTAFPLVAPVTTKSDIAVNPPVQSTIVSSKQFQDHAKLPKVQLHNSVAQKQELPDRSMVPIKLLHASQASAHLIERPISVTKHSPKAKLSGNNCFGYAASDLQKWAAAEKFQPSSKSSAYLTGPGQKVHLLNERNLGDSEKPSNQRSSSIIVKSYTSRLPIGNPEGTILLRTDQYNRDDLPVDYTYAKFFVIKSIGEADVHKSIKYGVWSSSSNGNSKLDTAFKDADRISRKNSTKCPVFLFFSVNGSGHFCGMAEMVGPVDFHKDMDFWCQDKWTGCFPVRWHIVKDIPNYSLQHITLQNNENKPVTHSRDTQEIPYIPGMSVLKIFKDIKVKECLFDDFMKYEVEEAQYKPHRRCRLSYNAPDFVPVSQRAKDVYDTQQTKSSRVLIDRTSEIPNVSEKPHDPMVIKPQEPCVERSEKQTVETGKENGQQENHCSGNPSQEDAAETVTIHRRCRLSYNAPDFVPVSMRAKDVSDTQQTKSSIVLIDRTSEIQNVSEKPHDPKVIKPQEPCVERSEKQTVETGKENGQQENHCSDNPSQEDAAKTVTIQRPPTPSLKIGADGKQQYWKKVENPGQHTDSAAQGSSKPLEKRLNGVRSSAGAVSESSEEQKITAKLGSLKISSKTGEADRKSSTVAVVTIGSMPVPVDSSEV